jgi:ferrochelatase
LGPTLDEAFAAAQARGAARVVVSPLGFATDHMEVLYDIDIVAKQQAADRGLDFARVPTLSEFHNGQDLIDSYVAATQVALAMKGNA